MDRAYDAMKIPLYVFKLGRKCMDQTAEDLRSGTQFMIVTSFCNLIMALRQTESSSSWPIVATG